MFQNGFVVPAPPLGVRRLTEMENFTIPTPQVSIGAQMQTAIVTSGCMPTANTTNLSSAITTAIATTVHVPSSLSHRAAMEAKDATLIELLKRGTQVAVKCAVSDSSGNLTFSQSPSQTATVLLPTQSAISTPLTSMTPTSTPPLSISLAGNTMCNAPMALTISQAPSETGDVYTLAYSTDSSGAFFGDHDVYNVQDTAMLLQAVDSIQLLQNSPNDGQLNEMTTIEDYSFTSSGHLHESNFLARFTPSRQLQAVLNSPLPDNLAEFSTLHSKDYVLYGCSSNGSPTTQSIGSPLPSPLSYPTPPASHEGVAQSSPFLDDSHHFTDANSFFDDKKNINFLEENTATYFQDPKDEDLTEDERILKLKNELFNDTKSVIDDDLYFKTEPTDVYETNVSDILGDSQTANEGMVVFNQNLSFLDEPQNFLDDARNNSSPLSAAFFTSTMSSAEEVKEALEEVLPNENMSCETDDDMDLYYLPALQSQIMLNSDDPLLSSSPKDFANKIQVHKFDFALYNPPSAKKPKIEICDDEQKPAQEGADKDIFLSPPNVTYNYAGQAPRSPSNSSITKKRTVFVPRKQVDYKSKMRTASVARYTPAPMLNPERNGTGLFASLATDIYDDVLDFDFSEVHCVSEIIDKSNVNIGTDFQAAIPKDENTDDEDDETSDTEIDDQQLWDPSVLSNERQIERFVDLAKSSSVPLGCHSEEMALQTLQEANGDIHAAIFAMMQAPPAAIHNRWQHHEIEVFLKGLEEYGKDFYKIANDVSHTHTYSIRTIN